MTMRPKRPPRPPKPPPPPIPAVVTPEDLVAVNVPEVNKLPAYSEPGKFQWTSPLPGPKGDTGEPGEQGEPGEPGAPGVIARPITPAVTADEIAPGAVTEEKLSTDSVTQTKIARNSVGWSEIREQSLEPEQIKTLSGEPATEGQVPVADLSEENQWWFKWVDAVTRPLTPPVATDEIGDGQVTPDKLSFTPAARPLDPPVVTAEIGDGAVTRPKLLYKVVTCIIPVGINSITTDPDPELVDGQILGYYPSQPVSSWVSGLALNVDGSITIRTYVEIQFANATFRVVVLRA